MRILRRGGDMTEHHHETKQQNFRTSMPSIYLGMSRLDRTTELAFVSLLWHPRHARGAQEEAITKKFRSTRSTSKSKTHYFVQDSIMVKQLSLL
jgi:hypothetical protein